MAAEIAPLALPRDTVRRAEVTLLSVLVSAGFAVHLALAWSRATPFFGDEYTYSTLSRSLATTGRPLIRGANAHFPALLQPLLTAPAWWLGSVTAAYRATQAIEALAMALAAVPVYLLARRLALGTRPALAAAALTLAAPSMLFSSLLMSEAIAFPLALAAVLAAVAALAEPSARTYVTFAAVAGAATFARFQLAILLPCFFAALVVARVAERRWPPRAERRLLGGLGLATLALALAGPLRNTGYYPSAVQAAHVSLSHAIAIAGADALTLLYGAGIAIVPGAVLGAGLMLARPRSSNEVAFAALAVVVTAALLAQAATYGITTVVQERYLIYLPPLWTLCFLVCAARRTRFGVAHLALAVALVAAVTLVPLTTYAQYAGTSPSPDLLAYLGVSAWLGSPGDAAATFGIGSAVLMLAVCLAGRIPGAGARTAVVGAAALLAVSSAAAYGYDGRQADLAAATYVDRPPRSVGGAPDGATTLLLPPGYDIAEPRVRLFWDRHVDRVALLPGAAPPDAWATDRVAVGHGGILAVGGRPLAPPVIFADGSSERFACIRAATRDGARVLVAPAGACRHGG